MTEVVEGIYRGFRTRAQCGLLDADSRSFNITPLGVSKHYVGSKLDIDIDLGGHAKCEHVWRNIQAQHKAKRWVDVAYTFAVCQHGYILAGRGAGVRTAANGTNHGNQHYYAIVALIGGDEVPTPDLLAALKAGIDLLRDAGAGNVVNNHSDHKPTACPGKWMSIWRYPEGAAPVVAPPRPAPTPVAPPKPAPVRPAPTGGKTVPQRMPTVRYDERSNAVKKVQGLLLAHGLDIGNSGPRRNGIDGHNGSKTNAALVVLCRRRKLVSLSTPLTTRISVGPRVWTELLDLES